MVNKDDERDTDVHPPHGSEDGDEPIEDQFNFGNDEVDFMSDESFPASDSPPAQPGSD